MDSGLTSGLYAGIGFLVVFSLLIVLLWAPWLVRRKRERRVNAGSSLVANLGRVVQLEAPSTSAATASPERSRSQDANQSAVSAAYERERQASSDRPYPSLKVVESDHRTAPNQTLTATETDVRGDGLTRRVAEMYEIVSSDSVSAKATAEWLRLLKELNDLHNAGEISTDTFRQMNTKLLSVI